MLSRRINDISLLKPKSEINVSTTSFLFAEIIKNVQKQCTNSPDLEKSLHAEGQKLSVPLLELLHFRDQTGKREIKLLAHMQFIHSVLWKSMFGKIADALERSTETEEEYMVSDNDLLLNRYISNSRLGSAFIAGVLEGLVCYSGFPAKVTAHPTGNDKQSRRVTWLFQFDQNVILREKPRSSTVRSDTFTKESTSSLNN